SGDGDVSGSAGEPVGVRVAVVVAVTVVVGAVPVAVPVPVGAVAVVVAASGWDVVTGQPAWATSSAGAGRSVWAPASSAPWSWSQAPNTVASSSTERRKRAPACNIRVTSCSIHRSPGPVGHAELQSRATERRVVPERGRRAILGVVG